MESIKKVVQIDQEFYNNWKHLLKLYAEDYDFKLYTGLFNPNVIWLLIKI